MKSPPRTSDVDGGFEEDLPAFESLRPGRRDASAPAPSGSDDASDFEAVMAGAMAAQRRPRQPATDFVSLDRDIGQRPKPYQARSFSDYLVAFLSPFFIFVMVTSVVFFLLDVRYVYTEVMDLNLTVTAFFFILGVVALNRLVVRDGTQESLLYIFGLGSAAALYTMALQAYDVGSLAGSFMAGPGAVAFNVGVVSFLWWFTNRLTHECCVDTHPQAGDIGILTGTARRLLNRIESKGPSPESRQRVEFFSPVDPYEPVDPTQWKKPENKGVPKGLPASERLKRRHPGISIFVFSVPVMAVFALGERVIQHGGPRMIRMGHVYVVCYTAAALMLLMLTSLSQLREYFRTRRTPLPPALSLFWISAGVVMVVIVLFAAVALPKPDLPPMAYVHEHEFDPWKRGSTFRLQDVVSTPVDIVAQSRFTERVGQGVLALLAAFAVYGLLRAVGAFAFAIARQRDRYPRFVVRFFDRLDRFLIRLGGLPRLPRRRPRIRISRDLSEACKFSNPLADAERSRTMSLADHIAYAYDALCALAFDMNVPRRKDQTPYEFIENFPRELSFLKEEAVELTHLFVLSNYANMPLDERTYDRLRKFWIHFERFRRHIVR